MITLTEQRNAAAKQLLADLKALYTALPSYQREEVQIALLTEATEELHHEQTRS